LCFVNLSPGLEWKEVDPPASLLDDFERLQDTLHTPKRLKVGPLLLATCVDKSPSDRAVLEVLGELAGLLVGATQAYRGMTMHMICYQ
jgi:hypothetical protein